MVCLTGARRTWQHTGGGVPSSPPEVDYAVFFMSESGSGRCAGEREASDVRRLYGERASERFPVRYALCVCMRWFPCKIHSPSV